MKNIKYLRFLRKVSKKRTIYDENYLHFLYTCARYLHYFKTKLRTYSPLK